MLPFLSFSFGRKKAKNQEMDENDNDAGASPLTKWDDPPGKISPV